MNHYYLHIHGINKAKLKLTYSNGKFKSLVFKSGKLTTEAWSVLMDVIPQTEQEMISLVDKPHPKLTYSLIEAKPKSQFTLYMDAYYSFYEKKNKLSPRINAVEGKALKMIISHLQKVAIDNDEALETWDLILSNWNKLDPFYQAQMDLKQINSNLNTILRILRNGKAGSISKNTAHDIASDFRQKV